MQHVTACVGVSGLGGLGCLNASVISLRHAWRFIPAAGKDESDEHEELCTEHMYRLEGSESKHKLLKESQSDSYFAIGAMALEKLLR